jgi:hypothetical protein
LRARHFDDIESKSKYHDIPSVERGSRQYGFDAIVPIGSATRCGAGIEDPAICWTQLGAAKVRMPASLAA